MKSPVTQIVVVFGFDARPGNPGWLATGPIGHTLGDARLFVSVAPGWLIEVAAGSSTYPELAGLRGPLAESTSTPNHLVKASSYQDQVSTMASEDQLALCSSPKSSPL